MTPGLQLTMASTSAFLTSKSSRLNTLLFSVDQLYSFCRTEFAEL